MKIITIEEHILNPAIIAASQKVMGLEYRDVFKAPGNSPNFTWQRTFEKAVLPPWIQAGSTCRS